MAVRTIGAAQGRNKGQASSTVEGQLVLPLGPIVNREFLSNHWLEHRLPLEPEWQELREKSIEAARRLLTLWKREKSRVARYGNEAGLEEKFIQPVFDILGWSIIYQTHLQGRAPDYALFTADAKLEDALQRTTAKEQDRRLIAAELPESFVAQHGGVIIENHLNMIRAPAANPAAPPAVIAAVLNSRAADAAFRCISGSVAVSAFELEAMPLPAPATMRKIARLLMQRAPATDIETAIATAYGMVDAATAA